MSSRTCCVTPSVRLSRRLRLHAGYGFWHGSGGDQEAIATPASIDAAPVATQPAAAGGGGAENDSTAMSVDSAATVGARP
jgi:hypothetical protein